MSSLQYIARIIACLLLTVTSININGMGERVSSGVLAISNDPASRIAPADLSGETFTSFTLEPGVRVTVQRSVAQSTTSAHVILYLLPNGSTTEQALGRTSGTAVGWHYNIQHIAAQTRRVREVLTTQPVITAVVEADTLSWPAWRKAVPDSNARVGAMVEEIRVRVGGFDATVDLIAHSGGGSFIWGFINSAPQIARHIRHIVFLDANYSYADEDGHGDKLLTWLKGGTDHRLIMVAYDDRDIKINGKPIVSDTGGTWRATDRMARRLERDLGFNSGNLNDLQTSTSIDGKVLLARHPNPEGKILHTVLVEENGFVFSALWGRTVVQPDDEPFSKTELYRRWILP